MFFTNKFLPLLDLKNLGLEARARSGQGSCEVLLNNGIADAKGAKEVIYDRWNNNPHYTHTVRRILVIADTRIPLLLGPLMRL